MTSSSDAVSFGLRILNNFSFKEPHLVNYLKIAENIFLKEFSIHFFQYFYAARKLFYVLSRVLVIFATAVLSKHL